ncbi:MAG: terminase small subunit [Porphyromonadaceae bacterium]|nr:terminase small subunit [Porphyromonadaceae bacterium]
MPSGKNATLTPKQETFTQGLFKGQSQREAYKEAFDTSRMNDNTIDVKACQLANTDKIRVRLAELQDELKERNMVTVEKVLNELSHIAFDDISNYLSYKTVKTVQGTDDEGEPIIGYKTVVDLKDSETIDTRSIAEVSIGPNGTFKFKQYCKDNALVQLGKYLGMFTEKVEHSGSLGVKIVDDIE